MDRPPLPPFNAETALQKVRLAEDLWNTRNPAQVVLAYTPDGQLAKSRRVLSRSRANASFFNPQMGARTGLSPH